jgi:leukotriene-A4 hydrolase
MTHVVPRSLSVLALMLPILAGCSGASPPPGAPPMSSRPARDVHSFARPDEARVTHVSLDLRADFAARTLSGSATLSVTLAPGARELVLDTDHLRIEAVTDEGGGALPFRLEPSVAELGEALVVSLARPVERVVVRYATSPTAPALMWLTPAQTAGRRHPYLYSQGQAILTRSWIPTQDSPGIRQTYDARITAPAPLRAVMSAEMLTPAGRAVDGGAVFEFRMREPIPPYLIAIAIGDLAFQELGPRSGVYTEPGALAAAAYELADLETMIATAEALGGPYRWGRYDVLVLPPSFPFGGMENPRLTFATPTIIAGDRSLVSLIAHELAHSWSGNLVTNATWSDFWLNEGFTTYFEGRIMEAAFGVERAAMLASLGFSELEAELAELPAADTRLEVELAGRNPDDNMTSIPYEKGRSFLVMIERAVGRERFDPYLRGYFDRHAFRSLTTAGFVADLREHLLGGDRELEARLRLDEWLHQPGLPSNVIRPPAAPFARVDREAARFREGAAAASLAVQGFIPQEWQRLLDGLMKAALTAAQVADLDATYRLSESTNAEILCSWLRLAIHHRHEAAIPAIERFLTGQGRRKFLKPLYEDLIATEWGRPIARRIYAKARPLYHAVATRTLDDIVK